MTNWILCFDGTWNDDEGEYGDRQTITNVVRLYQSISSSATQKKWYDKGVGTGFLDKIRGGLFGFGLDENIKQGYKWLSHRYQPKDRIFLFGFSRGAYTARSLAGLIRRVGLLNSTLVDDHEQDPWESIIHEAYQIYRNRTSDYLHDGKVAQDFRQKNSREVEIEFIGVWDTVGALGIPGHFLGRLDDFRYQFHDVDLSRNVKKACHAVAIDEHREDYSAALWSPDPRVQQYWFVGAHADVGGGYRDHQLADITLYWMQAEAEKTGIVLNKGTTPSVNGDEPIHDSFALFMNGAYAKLKQGVRFYRRVDTQALHDSVRERRAKNSGYTPPNL